MMRSPSVLTFAGFFLPGYKAGGPIQSVANMVAHLGNQFDFRIVTRDRDSGDASPYSSVVPGQWQRVGKAQVRYLSRADQSLRTIVALLREAPYDIIYLNSFFHWRLSVLPLLARKLGCARHIPVVLAPRGEFSQGALGLKSGKKRAFLKVARILRLHRDVIWHASSEHEARDIRTVLGAKLQIHVASDLPRAVQTGLLRKPRIPGEVIRVVFLSRIARMKNLTFVLEVLKRVRVPVSLSIVGFIDDPAYWDECQSLIAELPPHIKVSYDGMVPAEQVPTVLARAMCSFCRRWVRISAMSS
ncbi:glycosyltransferase [Sphingobium sp. Cam5-1]|uniref:glycosyltransferase n=1 Tax=Sphingobium sp. Cam5-1 TaxID=2789327 RepID=UPI0018AD2626|nr:glycosyltransferase [Sphingobium sp. Cam5-1]QPI75396.1 glycosyl transferase family 1 [Sphingobium sp. Cam5-1]